MFSSIRLFAVLATVAAAVPPAQAEPLSFDDLLPSNAVAGQSLSGKTVSSQGLPAFTFGSGAWVSRAGLDSTTVPDRNTPASNSHGAFIINDIGTDSFLITIDPNFNVNLLTLDYAIGSFAGLQIKVTFEDHSAYESDIKSASSPSISWAEGYQVISSSKGLIESILFKSAASTGLFAIDNLSLTYECTSNCGGTGGTVPEPASFGMVALALLGASVSSRRRRTAATV